MRAFVITLLIAAAPIYLGSLFFGGASDFGLGAFAGGNTSHYEAEAQDMAHDTMARARDYAVAHPEIVDRLKAHRAELSEFKERLCSAVKC